MTARAGQRRWLNLLLKDSTGAVLAGRPYTLTWPDGTCIRGSTHPDGALRVPVPPGVEWADLNLAWRSFRLQLDALAPIDTVAGAQARLNHLNYPVGPIDGIAGPRTERAVRAFQQAHGLAPTGALDPLTRARLEAEYGQ